MKYPKLGKENKKQELESSREGRSPCLPRSTLQSPFLFGPSFSQAFSALPESFSVSLSSSLTQVLIKKKKGVKKQCKAPTDDLCQAECIRRIHQSKKALDQEEVSPLFQALSQIWGHIMTGDISEVHSCMYHFMQQNQRQQGPQFHLSCSGIWAPNPLKSFCKPQCKCLCCKVRKISPANRAHL